MNKDIILKEIAKIITKEMLDYFFNIQLDEFEFLDIEFSKIELKKPDILIKSKNKIYHIEFQSSNDSEMIYRMMRYYVDISQRYKDSKIIQYVFYVGKKTLNMKNVIRCKNIYYKYEILDIKNFPCECLINSDTPQNLVLAVLCDYGDKKQEEIIKEILVKLYKLSKDENEFKKYLLMIEELSSGYNLKETIKEQEMRLIDIKWEDLPSYEIGLEKGIEKGSNQERLKNAIIMVKDFDLEPEKVAEKLNLPLEILLKEIK